MTDPNQTAGPDRGDPTGPPPALHGALAKLLRPLVRLMLAQQVTYPVLTRLLKSLYVEVAERDFAIEGKSQTVSRLSLLTGIHRKDVKRIRELPSEPEEIPASVSLGAQLVAHWTGANEYTDSEGHPRPLSRLASERAGISFEGLVASVSKDIRSRAVLDEWLRLGIVEFDDEDRVRLRQEAFVPDSGFEEKAYYLGRNVRDHIAAAAHNLEGGSPPHLERSVYYGELTAEAVEELESLSREEGMAALQRVNRRAHELKRAHGPVLEDGRRMNFGVYFYSEADDASPPSDGDAPTAVDEAEDGDE